MPRLESVRGKRKFDRSLGKGPGQPTANGQSSASGGQSGANGRWGHIYSALDLGTNNCRLLVAKPDKKGFRVIDSFSRIVRLGEGLDQNGALSQAAMDRALEALGICAAKMRKRGVTLNRCVATEACRKAANGAEFIERVREDTGLELDIITPNEEAKLAVAGCWPLVDQECDGALVFDIGGGSTELIWLDLDHRPTGNVPVTIKAWTSIPIGVISLAERFGGHDIPSQVYQTMVDFVMPHLTSFAEELGPFDRTRPFHMVGTSGTVTTIAGVHLELKRYDRRRVDGKWITFDDVMAVARRLSQMDFQARVAEPCVGRERADLVVAGCAILEAINNVWPCERLRVADRGLREGMLLALMETADRLHYPSQDEQQITVGSQLTVPAGAS